MKLFLLLLLVCCLFSVGADSAAPLTQNAPSSEAVEATSDGEEEFENHQDSESKLPKRTLLQKVDMEKGSNCTLTPEDVDGYLDRETRTWTLDDSAIDALDGDVQSVIDCTREGDTVLFSVAKPIRPSRRITLRWRLTLSAATGEEPVDGVFPEASNKTTFRCPSESEGVFLFSSKGALLANIVFERCSLDGEEHGAAAVVEVDSCEGDESGTLRMHHVRYSKNRLNFAPMLSFVDPSCSSLEMVDVEFDRNICDEGFCGVMMSGVNSLERVRLTQNDLSPEGSHLSPAILYAPRGASTSIKEITAAENEASVLNIDEGRLTIEDSRFIRNRVQFDRGDFSAAVHLVNSSAIVRRCRFEKNRVADSGAAIWAIASNVSIASSAFVDNKASNGAGLCIVNGTTADVSNCSFTGNRALSSGGGIRSLNATLTVSDCSFDNNTASRGAGIEQADGPLVVKTCRFEGNAASIEAGGIRCVVGECRLESLILVKNNAHDAGGAIVFENGTAASISNLACEDNVARLGGCLHVQATPLILEIAVFRGNNATIGGGAMSIRNTTSANVSTSVFESNSNELDGGSLYLFGNEITTIKTSQFLNNIARKGGAGIFIQHAKKVLLDDVEFEENASDGRGGAIYCFQNSTLDVRFSRFRKNRGVVDGGGAYIATGCLARFKNTTWIENAIEGSGGGGGLMIESGEAHISDSLFERNLAETGSCMHVDDGKLVVVDSRFHNNSASFYGTIAGGGEGKATIRRCSFEGNYAANGAIFALITGSDFTIEQMHGYNNTAVSGGCLMCLNSKIVFVDSIFESNTAQHTGGCFFGTQSEMDLDRVRVIGNKVDNTGGALWMSASKIRISNSLIAENRGYGAGGCIRMSAGELFMSNVTIERCRSGTQGGGLALSANVTAVVDRLMLTHNEAVEDGGGVHMDAHTTFAGSDLTIANNAAGTFGGGIFAEEKSEISFRRSRLASNFAPRGGGAVLLTESVGTMKEIDFVNNSAIDLGGDILVSNNATLAIIDCRAERSRAKSGGSIFATNSAVAMVDSEFRNEKAMEKGGALAVNGSKIFVDGVFVIDSSARRGGAVHLEGTRFEGRRLRVENNRAQDGGGVMAEISSTMLCVDCLFLDNVAEQTGGGVALETNETQFLAFQLDNCLLARNEATFGGGIHFLTPSSRVNCTDLKGNCTYLAVRGSEITDNKASFSGGAILASDLDTVRVDCDNMDPINRESSSFLSLDHLDKLIVLNSLDAVCPSWTNKAGEFGSTLASTGRGINVTVIYEETGLTEKVEGPSLFIPDHRSGSPLPTLFLVVVDALGQGPVPARNDRSIEAIMSSDVLFTGVLTVGMTNGTGRFSGISGYAVPGYREVRIDYDEPSIHPFVVTVEIRECTIGEFTAQNGTLCQRCPGGTFNFFPRTKTDCDTCPEGANCDDKQMRPEPGHWHRSPCSSRVQRCLSFRACNAPQRDAKLKNATTNVTNCDLTKELLANYSAAQCREGYEGALCGSCEDTHGRVGAHRCEKCLSPLPTLLLYLFSLTILMVFCALTIRGSLPSSNKSEASPVTSPHSIRPQKESKNSPSNDLESVKTPLSNQDADDLTEDDSTQSSTKTKPEEDKVDLAKWRAAELFKITINFLQDTAVAVAINTNWTNGLINMFQIFDVFGVVTSETATRSVDCLFPADGLLPRSIIRSILTVCNPMIVGFLFVFLWLVLTVRSKASWSYLVKRCTLTVLVVSYISYIAITTTAVNALHCIDVYDSTDPTSNDSTSYWAQDTSLRCRDDAHAILEATIGWPLLAMFSAGFPVVIATTFVILRHQLGLRNEWIFESAGFLYRAYRHPLVYWESIVMFRKAALAVVVVFSYPLGGNVQGILGIYVLVIALYFHISFRPYREEFASLNTFAGLSLFFSSLTFASGLFFNDDVTINKIRFPLTIIVIFINAGLLSVFIATTCVFGIEYLRLSLERNDAIHDPSIGNFKFIASFYLSKLKTWFGCCKTDETDDQTAEMVTQSPLSA